jgi:hypothetical protein
MLAGLQRERSGPRHLVGVWLLDATDRSAGAINMRE